MQMAMEHYGPENVCSHGDYMGKAPSQFHKLPFISGHFGFNYARELMTNRFSFTFLRNPIDRIVSLYCFCRARDPEEYPIYSIAAKYDFDGFLKAAQDNQLVRGYIWNSQTWCLASGPGLSEYPEYGIIPEILFDQAVTNARMLSYIGFIETFENDVKFIINKLNISHDEFIRKDNITMNKISIESITSHSRQLLDDLTQWDSRLYNTFFNSDQIFYDNIDHNI